MKIKMIAKCLNVLPAVCLFGLASCNGGNATTDAVPADTVASADIRGEWILENIVKNDTVSVRPAEVVPGTTQTITFTDSTYVIQTNCNTISGNYTVNGDSITLDAGLMTQMACENMATEDMLREVLPSIATVEVENDSIARLNGSPASSYIVLRKSSDKQ